jgi:hypothetical protein
VVQTVLIAYGMALVFALLGCLMVFLRTRYAGAVYLVIFGSIMVTAVKMGMVHERRIVAAFKRRKSDVTAPDVAPSDPAPNRPPEVRPS